MKPQNASQRLLKPNASEVQNKSEKTHRSQRGALFPMAMAVAAVEICHDQAIYFQVWVSCASGLGSRLGFRSLVAIRWSFACSDMIPCQRSPNSKAMPNTPKKPCKTLPNAYPSHVILNKFLSASPAQVPTTLPNEALRLQPSSPNPKLKPYPAP